jgi:hypothetical protein
MPRDQQVASCSTPGAKPRKVGSSNQPARSELIPHIRRRAKCLEGSLLTAVASAGTHTSPSSISGINTYLG